MSGISGNDNVNVFIAAALIAGLIAVLAFSFYYEIELSAGQPANDQVVPVVTVTATKIVIVTAVDNSTSCSTNSTNSTTAC